MIPMEQLLLDYTGTDKTIGYCLTKSWKVVQNFENYKKASYRPLLVIDNLSDERIFQK